MAGKKIRHRRLSEHRFDVMDGFLEMFFDAPNSHTVMPLRVILLSLFPVWKWARGQLSFKAKEIECASCDVENC